MSRDFENNLRKIIPNNFLVVALFIYLCFLYIYIYNILNYPHFSIFIFNVVVNRIIII